MLNFDLSNPRRWAPLFFDKTAKFSTEDLMSIQEEQLNYSPPNHGYAKGLQSELKDSIKDSMRGWRRCATSFRSDVGVQLTLIVEKLEQARLEGRPTSSVESCLPESITKMRTAFGFSLHIPFTNVGEILSRIESTEIHRNKNPQVEFGIGVRVFAYPSGLLSVWVFLCSLVPSA